MAVINLEGIKERGKFIKAQIDEQKRIEENVFWRRVETIRKSQKDCINFIDTYKALCENGMKKELEVWMSYQKKIKFYFMGDGGYISRYNFDDEPLFLLSLSDNLNTTDPSVSYYPESNDIEFSTCRTNKISILGTPVDTLIERTLKRDDDMFNKGLTDLATHLQPFLDEFYEWVMAL